MRVERCGICGTDLHEYLDGPICCPPVGSPHPLTGEQVPVGLGHEFPGVVADVGDGVTNHRIGDRVVVEPYLTCGTCPRCLDGRYNICDVLGFIGLSGGGGGFSEYVVADAVTGAGRGIGAAIARRFARDGYIVVVNDIDETTAAKTASDIGGRAVAGDVTDRDTVFGLVQQTVEHYGRLDTMVANAGIAQVSTSLEARPGDLRRIFDVNVFGVVYCIQAAAEQMIVHGGGGKIITCASIAAHDGFTYLSMYSGTKFAVRGITQAEAKEMTCEGIPSTPIAPASSEPTCGT